jgi:23S rRNA pseudouridine1911/1915/1917 synthase
VASRTLPVPPELDGARADEFLARLLGVSVRRGKALCGAGRVRRGGSALAKGTPVKAGDVVEVREGEAATGLVPVVPVVSTTDALVVVNKPAGLPCHRLQGDGRPSALEGVAAAFPEVLTSGPDPREGGLLHRLDNGTSGLLALARNPAAHHQGRAAFSSGAARKLYLALAGGVVPAEGVVDLPVAHHPADGRRGVVVADEATRHRGKPKPARTSWRVLAHGPATSLLLVEAQGGRHHQVRLHLLHAGAPLVGDEVYGGPPWPGGGETAGHGLHACWLTVPLSDPRASVVASVGAPPGWEPAVRLLLGDEGVRALVATGADPRGAWDRREHAEGT